MSAPLDKYLFALRERLYGYTSTSYVRYKYVQYGAQKFIAPMETVNVSTYCWTFVYYSKARRI